MFSIHLYKAIFWVKKQLPLCTHNIFIMRMEVVMLQNIASCHQTLQYRRRKRAPVPSMIESVRFLSASV